MQNKNLKYFWLLYQTMSFVLPNYVFGNYGPGLERQSQGPDLFMALSSEWVTAA